MVKKVFGRIGMKLILLIVPLFLVCPLAISYSPMWFLDGEYSYYLQNEDYAKKHEEYCRVLIMGDSTAKAAWLPSELSEDSYNFALGGASPIEEYFCLSDYLKRNEAPQYLVYMQLPGHFVEAETFWSRGIYFRRLSWDNLEEVLDVVEKYKNEGALIGDKNVWLEKFLYKIYSPTKYGQSFIKSFWSSKRFKLNQKMYEVISAADGQVQFGKAEFCDEPCYLADEESFKANGIIDFYFRKIIELCEKHDIQFVFMSGPINESTYNGLQKQFVDDYTSYLESIQKAYPQTLIDSGIVSYGNDCFGDIVHLNRKGTVKFSRDMREKYSEIFNPGGES